VFGFRHCCIPSLLILPILFQNKANPVIKLVFGPRVSGFSPERTMSRLGEAFSKNQPLFGAFSLEQTSSRLGYLGISLERALLA